MPKINSFSTKNLAAAITKTASKQTYYTIRFLVDRERVDDAYRAYAYFRWMDDALDSETMPSQDRLAFLQQQKTLLENCYQGTPPQPANQQETMLIDLVQHDIKPGSGLKSYLFNMMAVMEFDTARRGRLISQAELNEYTRFLATSVTEAMHYFIGHCCFAPEDDTRYLAVTAAHIIHMLRDTYEDTQAGYYNIPNEVLETGHITPQDVDKETYRAWVRSRIQLARKYFAGGQKYLHRVENLRCRLAGMAYTARFMWLLDTIVAENYILRPEYPERKRLGTIMKVTWQALASMLAPGWDGKQSASI